jgi:lipid-A-disaccharide synthase
VTVEAALLQVPIIVAYQVSMLSYIFGRTLLKTPYIAMPNILLGKRAVPEFRQGQVTAERLAEEALRVLDDEKYRETIRKDLQKLRDVLGAPGAIKRAAGRVLDVALDERSLWDTVP